MLVLNYYSICMDESWGDPENFRPERFLDDNGNVFIPKTYFPFSMGTFFPLRGNYQKDNYKSL